MKTSIIVFLLLISVNISISQCFVNENESVQNVYNVYNSSGNHWIDQSFYQQNQYLSNTLGLSVVIGFYDDSKTGPNAFAIPPNNTYANGHTYFGLNLLNKYLATGTNATYYMLWILAHEYAHILQYKYGGMPWDETKWNELQSDYIAGAVAAKHILENSSQTFDQNWKNYYINQYTSVAISLFEELGDTNFGSSSHHGKPSERASAFVAGLNYGFNGGVEIGSDGYFTYYLLLVDNVWYASKNYVNNL